MYLFRRFIREEEALELSIPELSDGFVAEVVPGTELRDADRVGMKEAAGNEAGLVPVSYFTERVLPGIYRVDVEFTAKRDIERLYLFTGRKQLREILSMRAGERFSGRYYQSVAEIIPRYRDVVYPVEHLFFTVCTEDADAVCLGECRAERVSGGRRVFLCGDSTVTDHAGESPYCPGAGYAAWGQALPAFLDGAAVENQAHCGLTTEDFLREGHFVLVMRYIREGDICLFQFGHNDQKLAHLWPNGEYPKNLRRFIREVRQKGAVPVLVTPLARNIWDSEEKYLDLLEEHAQAVRDVADEKNTALIELHAWSAAWIAGQGMEASCGYFHPEDYTHTNDYGAYRIAEFMAGELVRIFPELGLRKNRRSAEEFVPPKKLWERLGKAAGRISDGSRKEQFDCMEKSTAALLEGIAAAKREAGY